MPNRRRVAIALLALIVALPGVALAQPQILPPAGLVPLDSVVDVSQLPDETALATATTPKPALSPSGTAALQQRKQRLQSASGPDAVPHAAPAPEAAGLLAPNVTLQFDGISNADQGFVAIPPDDNLGVGPNHIFQMVNVSGRISTKAGTTLQTFTLNSFFQVTTGFDESDPHVIFDGLSNRWIAVYLEFSQSLGVSSLILAVSQTSDPTGIFCRYRLGDPANAANPNRETFIQDFPMLGVSSDKIVVSYNGFAFPLTPEVFVGAGYYVVHKADALACVGQLSLRATRVAPNVAKSSPWPSHDQGATTKVYLAQNNGPTLTVFTVDGLPGVTPVTETPTTVGIRPWLDPPDAAQLGSAILLQTNDSRVLSNAWQANSLYLTGNEACTPAGDTGPRSCLRVIEFRTDTLSIRQDMTFAGAAGDYFYFPAARPDVNNNLFVVFTSSSATAFAGVRVTGRLATDPLNTLQTSALIKPGGGAQQSTTRRWGDYSGAALDPSDPTKVWVMGEYVQFTANRAWGTWIARLSLVPPAQMNIDTPTNGLVVTQPFVVGGWAIDPAAPTGTGVDTVTVVAIPAGGSPISLGAADYGIPRPDVGAAFGARFTDSGFGLVVSGLSAGTYTLQVSVHSTASGANTVQSVTIQVLGATRTITVDTPIAGTTVNQPFLIGGWAIDTDATSGPGVDALVVYAVPTGGPAIFLGNAAYGGSRPDVGALFGAQFTNSGFALSVTGLAPATYQLLLFARSTVTGVFDIGLAVTITVLSTSRMAVDIPTGGASLTQPFVVAGWAIDTAAGTGTGVDAVAVYAAPPGGAATFLGFATYGGARPDVGALFGAQFTNSGFALVATGLGPGVWDILVFAHSTVTGAFTDSRTVRVVVPVGQMAVDVPAAGSAVVQPFLIAGWAFNPSAASGTGVDAVVAYAVPTGGGPVTFLGIATYGTSRPDVGAAFGAQFTNSGYFLSAGGLAPGGWQIQVYARNSITGVFDTARAVNITIP
jgi:hypothetical protein